MIRASLRGEAAHVLKRLGPDASLDSILQKFNDVYGMVETGEETLSEFYSAHQREDEDVSSWGCRLEDLLDRAVRGKVLVDTDNNDMLRKRFWAGLQPRLKEASRHKFDTTADFDRLRVLVRSIEHEYKVFEPPVTSKKVVKMATVEAPTEISELKGIVKQLSSTVSEINKQIISMQQNVPSETGKAQGNSFKGKSMKIPYSAPAACWNCGDTTHLRFECPKLPECFKCNKRGHLKKNCRSNRL